MPRGRIGALVNPHSDRRMLAGSASHVIGLAIPRGFVEALGRNIDAANRSDRRGAVFTIALPVPLIEKGSASA